MTINDKIKQILIDKNLTPSYFADEIGVQRSSISHILSGRNRPSFDIIQKIIRRFPDLGYEWIMEEDGSGYGQPSQRNQQRYVQDRYAHSSNTNAPGFTASQPVRTQRSEIPAVPVSFNNGVDNAATVTVDNESVPAAPVTANGGKKVERILIFYTDGSFREYTPGV